MAKGKKEIKCCYVARVERITTKYGGKLQVGSIGYNFKALDIKDAYRLALKKGEEVFGKATYTEEKREGEYNIAQVSSVSMVRNEDWKP